MLIPISSNQRIEFFIRHSESKSSKDLSELLWWYLKMFMSIKVLEETLNIKSLSSQELLEPSYNFLRDVSLLLVCICSSILSWSSSIIHNHINCFFKTLLCEDFVNWITEFSPFNMLSFFWCLEKGNKFIKFITWKHNLGHIEADSKLSFSNETSSKLIKVSIEFTDSDSLLLALVSYSS